MKSVKKVFLFTLLAFIIIACKEKDKEEEDEYIEIEIVPELVTVLSMQFEETSGLIHSGGQLWTHNDRGWFNHIYAIDKNTGNPYITLVLNNAGSVDYEDLAKSEMFIYVGDFGNNTGNRKDLKIYRVPKIEINYENPGIQYLHVNSTRFFYPEQDVFESGNQHNFDCEAFIWFDNHYYLFLKHRLDNNTTLYKIPAQPGEFAAEKLGNFESRGQITGADISPDRDEIVLLGYDKDEDVFIWVLSNFEGDNFFEADLMYIRLGTFDEIGQAEGISYTDDNKLIYISAEKTNDTPPLLYKISVDSYRSN
ncbi:MAG: hypothetical protein EA412_04615 [Chitinophagaceae bacterium]|nr:MAG: hypothetical protein EA412_04615 [Chitinophagaceae bacterium]